MSDLILGAVRGREKQALESVFQHKSHSCNISSKESLGHSSHDPMTTISLLTLKHCKHSAFHCQTEFGLSGLHSYVIKITIITSQCINKV
jgi:hypothetical protein